MMEEFMKENIFMIKDKKKIEIIYLDLKYTSF